MTMVRRVGVHNVNNANENNRRGGRPGSPERWNIGDEGDEDDASEDPLTQEELDAALRRMAKGKATGPDEIPAAVWTALDDDNREALLRVLNKWWKQLRVPNELLQAEVVSIF